MLEPCDVAELVQVSIRAPVVKVSIQLRGRFATARIRLAGRD